jgi:hypothetical protein
MRGSVRAGLAVAMCVCVFSPAIAAEKDWLTDAKNSCAVLGTGSGDSVAWTGACEDGLAEGLGTATFFKDGKEVESFTADFARGMVADGHVISRWGDGWNYHGEQKGGRFEGGGVLVNDRQDRFLGIWTDGKMNGFGLLDRADGSRYAGEWRDSLPNGEGELRRADGSIVAGLFTDGRLVETRAARADSAFRNAVMTKVAAPALSRPSGPFAALAGVRLKGADGSIVALSPIEGGIEMALTPAGGVPQKTTFTFMTEKMGTVVEDGSGHGANVTGFFRLTDTGVELHYADGRAETLTAGAGGGVTAVTAGGRISCRSWYPEGHVFSEAEKKAALADYAVRLGLPVTDSEAKSGCPAAAAKTAAAPLPLAAPTARPAAVTAARPAKNVKTAFVPAPPNTLGAIKPVAVRDSQVHAVDDTLPPAAMAASAAPVAKPDGSDPSRCLKVESDGYNWGFRNACDFALQFSYCLVADKGLAACGNGGAPGSVAARGFGALIADKSLSATGADHKFRWIACVGGAGEVIARLERADPPSGRCERNSAITAAN